MKKGAQAADVSTTVVSTVSANNSGSSPVPSAEVQRRLPLRLLRLSMDNLLLPFLQMHR